jgi:hypothetical protein
MNIWIVIGVIALMLLGSAVQARAKARARDRRFAACRAVADRHGLEFTIVQGSRGAAQQMRLTDPARGLTLTVTPDRDTRRTDGGLTSLHLQTPAFVGGLAIYAEAPHPDLARATATFAGLFDNDLSRKVIGQMLDKDLADRLGGLQAFPATDAPTLAILADADPARWFDAAAIARAIDAAPRARRGTSLLLVLLTTGGMELRLLRALMDPDALDGFLTQGLSLQEALPAR